jgi:hypothetical protein
MPLRQWPGRRVVPRLLTLDLGTSPDIGCLMLPPIGDEDLGLVGRMCWLSTIAPAIMRRDP